MTPLTWALLAYIAPMPMAGLVGLALRESGYPTARFGIIAALWPILSIFCVAMMAREGLRQWRE